MHLGTERNILDRQRIARQNVGFLAAQDHRSDLQTDRGENVTLFTVKVRDQRDVCRAVRIIFELGYASRNARLIAFEIDNAVMTLVSAAAPTDRDPSIAVASGYSLFR